MLHQVSRSAAGRLLEWLLPIGAAAYLVTVHDRQGWFGTPYWFSLVGPVTAVVAPWVAVAALRSRDRRRALRVTAVVVATAVLLMVMAAWPAHLIPHVTTSRRLLVAVVGGAIAFVGVGTVLGYRTDRAPSALEVLIAIAVASSLETDLYVTSYGFDRDLRTFLRAGADFIGGRTVYVIPSLAALARDPTLAPFVYPPVTLPLFGALNLLSLNVAETVWLVSGTASIVVALRRFGVGWRWLPVLLLWPPAVQGLWVGNADVPVLVFFALIPGVSWVAGLSPLVKVQLGLPGLWLLREARWRGVASAALLVTGLLLVTLPVVGLGRWGAWFGQLDAFARFITIDPPSQGVALQRYLGPVLATLIGLSVLVVALARRGGDGLASLGLASLALSPTLYPHGLTLGLPGVLRLCAPLFWLAFVVTSTVYGTQAYWLVMACALIAPAWPALTHAPAAGTLHHPLGDRVAPWGTALDRPPGSGRPGPVRA